MLSLLLICYITLISSQQITVTCQDRELKDYPYCNPSLPISERVNDLISRMTIMEKVTMYNSDNYGIPRLGVLPLGHSECNRGSSVYPKYYGNPDWPTTTFPQATLLGGAFYRNGISRMARSISNLVRAKYNKALQNNLYVTNGFGLACWAPMLNICRDPRWGRCQEGYGEDTMLMSEMGKAYIPNLQHDPSITSYYQALTTCKHFDLENGPEKDRKRFNTIINYRDWIESFRHHFRTCTESGTASYMCSYNAINGVPACANNELLIDLLRNKWKFNGYVTSDCGAITQIYSGHLYAHDYYEAAQMAIKNGCDWVGNCNGPVSMETYLYQSIINQTLPEYYIDDSLRKVLPFWFKLGLIDEPMSGPWKDLNLKKVYEQSLPLAYELGYKSMVLLKNDYNILPLNFTNLINNKQSKYGISIIGPCANNTDCYSGDYQGNPLKYISITDTLFNNYGINNFIYVPGCLTTNCNELENITNPWTDVIDAIKNSDLVIYIGGISIQQEQEGIDREIIEMPPIQAALFNTIVDSLKANQQIVSILCYGTPVINEQLFKISTGILGSGYGGQMHGESVVSLINGTNVPSGKNTMTWYNNTEMLGLMHNFNMTKGYGKTYRYFKDTPIYSFGYGLSYTTFEYNNIALSSNTIKPCDTISVSFSVKNNGTKYVADESSMVYLRILNDTYVTTNIRLVNFTRNENINISQTIDITMDISPLWMTVIEPYYFDELIIPGEYEVLVGGNMYLNKEKTFPGFLRAKYNIVGDPVDFENC